MHGSRVLYLARHGETDWNAESRWQGQTDVPLNDRGREQALDLAGRLRGAGLRAVASSDLARARVTAEIVAGALGLAVDLVDPDLRERGYGCFEGLTRAEVAERFPDVWARHVADPGPAIPGGESRDELLAPFLVEMPRPHAADWRLHGIQNGHVYRVVVEEGRVAAAERFEGMPGEAAARAPY